MTTTSQGVDRVVRMSPEKDENEVNDCRTKQENRRRIIKEGLQDDMRCSWPVSPAKAGCKELESERGERESGGESSACSEGEYNHLSLVVLIYCKCDIVTDGVVCRPCT